ncbi:MarR family transcriptional regulator [Methyloligella sp. 2.7D]|uniref:MarR family winged helix-turn-helix transcriptional regulator n=1 Tax=unclassified Methyloligella TaxID=2625955 RepID=UPI00157CDE5A|nr:MarR family transcriptional regulator [Methyloligella sp. GL2]QKP75984.1 MarR family transcriptional regulator [Methyloligella sp. GL2]
MTTGKAANVLGALALTLSDRIQAQAEDIAGLGGMGPAILVAVDVQPGILIERLAVELGRVQSSTVRAVQQLERAGFIEKRRGDDRRTLGLYLTEPGKARMRTILRKRAEALGDALAVLSPKEQAALSGLIERMLEALVKQEDDRFPMCRLCDEEACGEDRDCPVERGAARCRQKAAA